MLRRAAMVRIGISGWRYPPWRGVFYPTGLPQRKELAFAAERFNSIEINGSFYSLQRPEYYRRWYSETPPDFVFAVKGGRYITHFLKLRDVRTALANFFASGVLALEEKLGPILWQFPESFAFEESRFDEFFRMLPRDSREAAKLAKEHHPRLAERNVVDVNANRRLRHAVEVRSPSAATAPFVQLLRHHGIALVVADTAGRWPYLEDVTADFMYIRLHGDKELYKSGYSRQAIARWSRRIAAWSVGGEPTDARRVAPPGPARRADRHVRDVYVYFDNDIKVHAPFDAIALAKTFAREVNARADRPGSRAPSSFRRRDSVSAGSSPRRRGIAR